jgi:hypothetical protein
MNEVHRTTNATTTVPVPADLDGMTCQAILAAMQERFRLGPDEKGNYRPANPETRYLHAVFEAISDPDDWRNGFAADSTSISTSWMAAAVKWFHGTDPVVGSGHVYSPGYGR